MAQWTILVLGVLRAFPAIPVVRRKRRFRASLNPASSGLAFLVTNMIRIVDALLGRLRSTGNRFKPVELQDAFPAGHYYSPIPSSEDVLSYFKSRKWPRGDIPGIQMNKQAQRELLGEYVRFYKDIGFPVKQTPGHRYFYDNSWFGYTDSILLYCFLRKHEPKRIVEVGSGFSSAVILDTVDGCFARRPEITFIEPYPERLASLLREDDRSRVNLIGRKVQEVSLKVFGSLQSGDLLFIDSSHVVKCGSDLQFLFFEVLPCLQPGVFVHFHDVFYPFDYPLDWMTAGRHWNENYFLRAFLSWNSEWQIRFFNTYVLEEFRGFIKKNMPLCAKNDGASLYIQRIEG